MATPKEVHKYQFLSGEAPAYGIHDNPSPLTSDLLRNEYKIQSWPRKSERKSAGGDGTARKCFLSSRKDTQAEMALSLPLNLVSECDALDKSFNLYNPYLWRE